MLIDLADLTQDDAAAGFATAVLPLAALESHGPHLPLGTDAMIAAGLLAAAAECDSGPHRHLVAPTLWLGASAEHAATPGTLSREPEQVVQDVVAAGLGLGRMGISRLVLLVTHGGNIPAAAIAAMRLRATAGLLVAHPHWLDFGLPEGLEPPAPAAADWHGGWIETSVMLHLHPSRVRQPHIRAHPPAGDLPAMLAPSGPVPWGWTTPDLAGGGAIGWPDRADADTGRRLVEHAARRLVTLLDGLAVARWPRGTDYES